MQQSADIHHYARRLELGLSNLEKDKTILPVNRKLIKDYLKFRQAEDLSIPRQLRYIDLLKKLSRSVNKPLKRLTRNDVMNYVSHLNRSELSPETQQTEKKLLKTFVRWLRYGPGATEDPEETKWLKTGGKVSDSKLPQDILDESDIEAMAKVAPNARDRAFLLSLYESGARATEWLTLKVGSLVSHEHGTIAMIQSSKTGQRRVLLVMSSAAMGAWLEVHPARGSSDFRQAPLWTSLARMGAVERWEYPAMRKELTTLARKAGIVKPVNPHAFRHSRATQLSTFMTESQMKQVLGWSGDSRQAARYVHLSGRDTDDVLLKANGIEVDEKNKGRSRLRPIRCPRCRELNDTVSLFCRRCGTALSEQKRFEIAGKVDYIEKTLKSRNELSPEVESILEAIPEGEKVGILSAVVEQLLKKNKNEH